MNKLSSSVALATSLCALAAHATEPAVSGPNAKISVQAGTHDHSAVEGSFTFPLSHSWGAQIDLANSRHVLSSSGGVQGIGGHLFWRDPARGLLGVSAAHLKTDLSRRTRLTVQGEKFWDEFTLRGHVGQERGHGDAWKKIGLFTRATAAWYAQPDLVLDVRADRSFDRNSVGMGAEWQFGGTASTGYALFAEVSKASAHSTQSMVGFRVYFDSPKSLKSRHRTGDPVPVNGAFGWTCPGGFTLVFHYNIPFCTGGPDASSLNF